MTIRRPSTLILVAVFCGSLQLNLMNAALFPLFDAVLSVARDVNVGAGIAANLAILLAALHRPALLREGPLAAAALAATVLGTLAMALALAWESAALLCCGAIVQGLGGSWIGIVCAVARCELSTRELFVGLPCAFAAAQVAGWALVMAGLPFETTALLFAGCPLVAYALARPFARPALTDIAAAPAQADAALLHPASFLPLSSKLFACMFATTVALGFNLRFGPVEGELHSIGASLAVFAGVAALGVVGQGPRRYDALLSCSVIVLVAGFLVAPLADFAGLTQALISMAGAFLNTLFPIVLTSAAARNRLSAVGIFAWGSIVSSTASIVGANAGLYVASNAGLGAQGDAPFLISAGIACALLAFALFGLKGFSIAATIEGIEPLEPVCAAPASETERIGTVCARLGEDAGLTPREQEVLALIARGRNNSFIQEELVLTRNTVKTYIKRIYAKLDVHSQQEVIDLVEKAHS